MPPPADKPRSQGSAFGADAADVPATPSHHAIAAHGSHTGHTHRVDVGGRGVGEEDVDGIPLGARAPSRAPDARGAVLRPGPSQRTLSTLCAAHLIARATASGRARDLAGGQPGDLATLGEPCLLPLSDPCELVFERRRAVLLDDGASAEDVL